MRGRRNEQCGEDDIGELEIKCRKVISIEKKIKKGEKDKDEDSKRN